MYSPNTVVGTVNRQTTEKPETQLRLPDAAWWHPAFGLAEASDLLSGCFSEISPDGQEDVNQIQTRTVVQENNCSGEKVKW